MCVVCVWLWCVCVYGVRVCACLCVRVCCLSPAVVFNSCRLEGPYTVATESDLINAAVGDRRQSHMLRFGKCL